MADKGINVDEIAPMTPELWAMAKRRCSEIVQAFGKSMSIWGTQTVHGPEGEVNEVPTIAQLAAVCYAQGVRGTAAVAAVSAPPAQPDVRADGRVVYNAEQAGAEYLKSAQDTPTTGGAA